MNHAHLLGREVAVRRRNRGTRPSFSETILFLFAPVVPSCSCLVCDDCPWPLSLCCRQAVHTFIREKGRPPVVLDIGCGTGLLSMLAVRAGASEVFGCELYDPLAQIAREVTALNCGDNVKASLRVRLFDAVSNNVRSEPAPPLLLRFTLHSNSWVHGSPCLGVRMRLISLC